MAFTKTRKTLIGIVIFAALSGIACYLYLKKDVTVSADGRIVKVSTFSRTVGELIRNQNINLAPEDVVVPGPERPLEDGMKIEIKRAFPVKILYDGKEKVIRSQPDTVNNLLSKAGINLGKEDRVEPGLAEYIDKPGQITVIRVNQKIVQELKEIPYEIITRKDPGLPVGQKKVIQQGEVGQERIITTMTLENGKVVSKKSQSVVIKPPKPKIVLAGSMLVASRGGIEFAYTRKLRMLATAYTHTGSLTATDTKPRAGVVAVDPEVIPLGSRLYIDGYGFGRAEDTGGAIKGEKIDLFMETRAEARRFGRRWVTVYVLK
ncbi:ubiquitin-like domain-containing protein [Thermoanaerobacterium sp. DL9XJH110]|uniref:ubiquitin-like domain-containing protein n=1 Tax=Thermoanaerobacterium sp. DL9XJH110 TaxID=3386643 RepID=UPI003BB622A6